MPEITSIKQQKNKNRVNVYLDNKFGFGIDLDNFVILNLKVGQELAESEVEKIIRKAEFQKTLDKLLKFAMLRPRSEKEIDMWLSRKKVPQVIRKDLFHELKRFELIDDTKFAQWWVEQRNAFRPKSKRVLKGELRVKGINSEIIDRVLTENKIDEEKIAKEMLSKRESHWKVVEKAKKEQKMLIYLIGQGFGFDVAKLAVREYNMREDERVK